MHPRTLAALLEQSDQINALMPQAKRLLELRALLAESLPEDLARNCTVANWRQGKLVVFAWNSAVAAKLNLLRPALLRTFQARRSEVTAMEIQVQPQQREPHTPSKHAILAPSAAESLRKLASQLSDSELQSAVLQLAERNVSGR